MIIHDDSNYKVDVDISTSNNPNDPVAQRWLQLTTFNRKHDDWVIKVVRIPEQSFSKLIGLLISEGGVTLK